MASLRRNSGLALPLINAVKFEKANACLTVTGVRFYTS